MDIERLTQEVIGLQALLYAIAIKVGIKPKELAETLLNDSERLDVFNKDLTEAVESILFDDENDSLNKDTNNKDNNDKK